MKEKLCFDCGDLLTKANSSVEHIIPNGIGGKWKSKDLLCAGCNAKYGETIDAVLCKDLLFIASSLMISRERGEFPSIKNVKTKSGEIFHLEKGRIPVHAKPDIKVDEVNQSINIRARDMSELRQIIQGLKRTYPDLQDQHVMEKAEYTKSYLDEPLHLSVSMGGPEFGKAVLKIAIGAWLASGYDIHDIAPAIELFKKTPEEASSCLKPYYTQELADYSDDIIEHIIYFKGDPEKRLLYAYVELFNVSAYIIHLNTDYTGALMNWTYKYNVLTGEATNIWPPVEYDGVFPHESLNDEYINLIQRKIRRVLAISDKRQNDMQIQSLIKEAFGKALSKHAGATHFTEDIICNISREVGMAVAPFIMHIENMKRRTKK